MIDQSTRTAILRLRDQGHGSRAIAFALEISRGAVKRVIRAGNTEVPRLVREELAQPHHDEVVALHESCKGNLVRVHEELVARGAQLSYQALTAFCRRHHIGYQPPVPAGHYEFAPGVEMQHDTSPHHARVGGVVRAIQTAALVLAYSRMRFIQCYPRFTRFECKVFLTDAIRYFGGACSRCMIDNTHVVVLSGTGRGMKAVPEMVAFGDRFDFEFVAHELGHADRSAHVERTFDYVENNFLAGREFTDWAHLQSEARAWSDKVNATFRPHLHASPRELFAREQAALRPLPLHVPEVYMLHDRIVDTEGYVNVRCNRYSVPWQLIGRRLEVRESRDEVAVFDGPRLVATHPRALDGSDTRVTDTAHRPPRGEGAHARHGVSVEERRLAERFPQLSHFVALLKRRGHGTVRALRGLLRIVEEYPRDAVLDAVAEATRYGLTDLDRLERMVLRRIATDFFPRPPTTDPEDDHD